MEGTDSHNPPPLKLDNTCSHVHACGSFEKLTRSLLTKDEDWNAWEAFEQNNLDQQLSQRALGCLCIPLSKRNLPPLIYACVMNPDVTKNAPCACNGSPRQK